MKRWYISHVFIYLDVAEFLLGNSDSFSTKPPQQSPFEQAIAHEAPSRSLSLGHTCGSQYQWNQWCDQPLPRNLSLNTYALSSSYILLSAMSHWCFEEVPCPLPHPQFSHTETFFPVQPFNNLLTVVPKPLFTLPRPHTLSTQLPSRGRPITDPHPPLH